MSAFRYVPVELLVLAVLAALAAAAPAAVPGLRRRDHRGALLAVVRVLLAGAVLAILAVTMVTGRAGSGVNLVPGAGIRSALSTIDQGLGLLNTAGAALGAAVGVHLAPLLQRRGSPR